jgi:hypothetical protein
MIRVPVIIVAAAVCVAGCGTDGGNARASESFTVSSTLDGQEVLPHRIRWVASVRPGTAHVREVQFLIDGGKPRWVEREAPYTFGDDFDGEHQGSLVTSWLAPGTHRFTVRVLTDDGRTAVNTVVVRVLPAPAPPAAIAGTWKRRVPDTSGAPAPGSPGNPTETLTPPGTYTMVIDKRWIQTRFPGTFHSLESDDTGAGWILDSDYSAQRTGLRVLGAVIFDTHHDQAELGWWCWPDGPPADYRWSARGDRLTLTPAEGADPCEVRGFVWAGVWTRVR